MAEKKCKYCPKVFVIPKCSPRQILCGSPECLKAYKRDYAKSPVGLAVSRRGCAKYRQTAKGQATRVACRDRLYKERKSAGICAAGACGKRSEKGHVYCCACLERMAQHQAKRYAAKKAQKAA